SMTSSTSGSFSSWNFFFMFSFTSSGFSRTNLISSICFPSQSRVFKRGEHFNQPFAVVRAVVFKRYFTPFALFGQHDLAAKGLFQPLCHFSGVIDMYPVINRLRLGLTHQFG